MRSNNKALLSPKEAADLLGMNTQTLRVLIQNGKIPGASCLKRKINYMYIIPAAAINKFINGEFVGGATSE